MAEEEGRPLGPVLMAAFSTFALFVVTSMRPVQAPFRWEWAVMRRYVRMYVVRMVYLATLPASPFIEKAVQVMYVWQLQRKLKLDRDYISTITFCRAFIQLQPRTIRFDIEACVSATETEAQGAAADDQTARNPHTLSPWLRPHHMPPSYHPSDWRDGESIDKERVYPREYVETLDSLQLCFAGEERLEVMSAAGPAPYMKLAGVTSKLRGQSKNVQKRLRLHEMPFAHSRKEREALLAALPGPGALKEKLEFARDKSRSVFPNLVRILQALGYMWGVLERVVQKEAVSPVEAVLTYLSVLVALQMIMELYVCTHFSRVLVLRLSRQQYAAFFKARNVKLAPDHTLTSFHFRRARVCVAVLLGLVSAAYVYHSLSNRREWRCDLCFTSILLFLLVPMASVLNQHFEHKLFHLLLKHETSQPPQHTYFLYLALAFFTWASRIISVTSMILALVATIDKWKKFNSKTNTSYAWILPHISS